MCIRDRIRAQSSNAKEEVESILAEISSQYDEQMSRLLASRILNVGKGKEKGKEKGRGKGGARKEQEKGGDPRFLPFPFQFAYQVVPNWDWETGTAVSKKESEALWGHAYYLHQKDETSASFQTASRLTMTKDEFVLLAGENSSLNASI